MRQDGIIEGALPAKHHDSNMFRMKKNLKNHPANGEGSFINHQKGKIGGLKKIYPPCQHCGKKGHQPFKCWRRPDAKCTKCNKLGHEAVTCRSKPKQQDEDAKVVYQ